MDDATEMMRRLRKLAYDPNVCGPNVHYAPAVEWAVAELERLDALINSPHTENFLEAVRTEAAHQRERWGVEHDAGKSAPDWFWLIGYVAGKALNPVTADKRLHHVITTAAVCLNWHAHITGTDTTMRPGIEAPQDHVVEGDSNG